MNKTRKRESTKEPERGVKRKHSPEPENFIELVDLDSDDSQEEPIVISDEEPQKEVSQNGQSNELSGNKDYIAFDFSSDDEAKDSQYEYDNYDDEYLSNDETQSAHEPKLKRFEKGETNPQFPWIKNHDHSKEIEIADWLTLEIKDFIQYISPSAEEIELRNATVRNLREAINGKLWSDCEVQVFGSSATDLYLPGSDIDMVITSPSERYNNKSCLFQLSSFLRSKGLATHVEVIHKAKVPIIKFVEPHSKIHIDVSFERTNGLTAAVQIRTWIEECKGLRELVLIIKQFLSVRKLNNVHVGGLGGYSIICLVYSFMRLHPRLRTNSIDPLENLGVLLIEFFELYGYNFAYDAVALGFQNGDPCYLKKSHHPALQMRGAFALAIQDPGDASNNISRGSFNIRDIKRSFGGAFELLSNKCYDLHSSSYKDRLGQSVLGGIIKYNGKQRNFEDARDEVVNEAILHSQSVTPQPPSVLSFPRSTKGSLPPLPSQKHHKRRKEVNYYSDVSVSSDEDSFNGQSIKDMFNTSQDGAKEKKVDNLMGITDENDSEDMTHAPSNESESEKETNNLDKKSKRDFWALKSGGVMNY